MRLSQRMARLGTETAFEVLVRARALEAQGRNVVHLEIGEPDFDTPGPITEAAIEALRGGATHYGPSAGLPELREAVAQDSTRRRGVRATPEMVVVTPGAKPIMFFVILALVDEGDEVLYPNPGFPIYESMIRYIGGNPVPVRLLEEKAFTLDEGEHRSIAALPGMEPLAIILDGFSKTYAMTGWRLGYGIMPAPMAQLVAKLQTNATSCTATFTQMAGVEALRGDQSAVERMVAEFLRRRDVIVDGLRQIRGLSCVRPKGAFYVFPNITGTGFSSRTLADRLLDEAGVACLSGTAFGEFGEGHLRFSYATSMENIEEALRRIRGWIER